MGESVLAKAHIGYLGSSITLGYAAEGYSYAEAIAEITGCTFVKEAVSGTTLCEKGEQNYIARLHKMDKNEKYDLFVVQLSTNDAYCKYPLGNPENPGEDTLTICGAIAHIVRYVKDTFHCPVIFYTNPPYDCPEYKEMVKAIKVMAPILGISVIDLYFDVAFNAISCEARNMYMADTIHPTKLGYEEWWAPKMIPAFIKVLEENK